MTRARFHALGTRRAEPNDRDLERQAGCPGRAPFEACSMAMLAWCALAAALAASPPDAPGAPEAPDGGSPPPAPAPAPARDGPTITVQPGTAKPGDPVFIVVEGAK